MKMSADMFVRRRFGYPPSGPGCLVMWSQMLGLQLNVSHEFALDVCKRRCGESLPHEYASMLFDDEANGTLEQWADAWNETWEAWMKEGKLP